MSMCTSVIGFVEPNQTWQQMKAVYEACSQAGIEAPQSVLEFFDHRPPSDRGVEIDLVRSGAAKEWKGQDASGFEIELSNIPTNVTHIRFVNSW